MPSGLIEDHDGVGAGIDSGADLGQMRGHGRGVAPGHDQPGRLALLWADGAEDVGPFGALVVGRAGPGSAPGPTPGDGVFLPDPRLVLEPQLYLCPDREARPDLR